MLQVFFSSSQNIKIQRSVGRAREGTTFPLSLKLEVNLPVEDTIPVPDKPAPVPDAEILEDDTSITSPVDCSFRASIWVFTTISGLITVQADGTIYGINNTFSLMLFGYEKKELLGKVLFCCCFCFPLEKDHGEVMGMLPLGKYIHSTADC